MTLNALRLHAGDGFGIFKRIFLIRYPFCLMHLSGIAVLCLRQIPPSADGLLHPNLEPPARFCFLAGFPHRGSIGIACGSDPHPYSGLGHLGAEGVIHNAAFFVIQVSKLQLGSE